MHGKVCGDDGCGGVCGTCDAGSVCVPDQSECSLLGTSCANAITSDPASLPFETTGENSGSVDTGGSCADGSGAGLGRNLQFHSFRERRLRDYHAEFCRWLSSLVSLHTDCADTAASCLGGQDFYGNPDGSLVVNLDADIPVFIVVDSFSSAELGAYSLKVDLIGNSCENPILVDAGNLPYSYVGDNTGFGDSSEQCSTSTSGSTYPDVVFSFTPVISGAYTLSNPSFNSGVEPSLFSVFTTCGDAENSCVEAVDIWGSTPDEFTVAMDAGTTYFIAIELWPR